MFVTVAMLENGYSIPSLWVIDILGSK